MTDSNDDSFTNDYASDSSDTINYHRPIFLKRSVNNKDNSRHHKGNNKEINPIQVKNREIRRSETDKNTIERGQTFKYVVFTENNDDNSSSRKRKKVDKPDIKNNRIDNPNRKNVRKKKKYYEYGGAISGYRFISNDPFLLEQENSKNTDSEPNIDKFQYDRVCVGQKRSWFDSTSNGDRAIEKYWSSHDVKFVPLIDPENGMVLKFDDINVELITKNLVRRFYEKSNMIMKYSQERMLKQDRIKWHPDKLRTLASLSECNKLKITRLFQIINELWETVSK